MITILALFQRLTTMSDSVKLHALGITHFRAGRFAEAVQAFGEAYEAAEMTGDRQRAAEILNDMGVTRRELSEWSQAEAVLKEAYALFAELGNVKGKAQVLGNMGSVLEGQANFQEAADAYKQSAKMFEEIGDSDSAMYTWQALSRMRMKQGQWLPAIAAYEEGIENMPDHSLKKGLLSRILKLPGGLLRGR
jgi:tetratricopeptide (TPR) repeat protein